MMKSDRSELQDSLVCKQSANKYFLSVIALTKLYDLDDPRLSQVHVKGDLIVPQSDRIMTRSRARQNPDQYTVIPASLKVVKVLVEELLSASGANQNMEAAAAAGLDDEGSDDGDWEDESNPFLDLGAGVTKEREFEYSDLQSHDTD